MEEHYSQLITWAFQGLLGWAVLSGVNTLSKLKDSVEQLNLSLAQVIEKMAWHEKELEKHDDRLTALEK